jgi:hypothetical protein
VRTVSSFVYEYSEDIATLSSIIAAATIEVPGVGGTSCGDITSGVPSTERDVAVEPRKAVENSMLVVVCQSHGTT